MNGDLPDRLKRAWSMNLGEYDKDDVERRGQRLRRRRTAWGAILAGSAVLAILISGGVVVSSVRPSGETADDSPALQAKPSVDKQRTSFVPTSRPEGGKTIMSVTFPDGTTAEVVYPSELRIAELGARPSGGWGTLVGQDFDGCCARDFLFEYGDADQGVLAVQPAIKEFTGADGRPVLLVPGPTDRSADYLVFRIGPWRLGIWASMSDDHLALWASNLRGEVRADGFPVLSASEPLDLAEAGEGGPFLALEFGGPDDTRQLSLQLRECDRPRTIETRGQISICQPNWSMWVNVSGTSQFVDAVARNLEIRDVKLGTN